MIKTLKGYAVFVNFATVPRPQFERCVRETQSDKFCKEFSTWKQFVILTYAR
ncbi:MAG: DUF4372 domain-containing protein [Treponema sp.]|nr:DUF4372 domain-containing protein [Treponema sp.]